MKELRRGVNAGIAARAGSARPPSLAQDRPGAPSLASPEPSDLDEAEAFLGSAGAEESEGAALPAAPLVSQEPLTADARNVDKLLAKSAVWSRIQAAIAAALSTHPIAAAAVARALRGLQL